MLDVKLFRVFDRSTDMVVVATNFQADYHGNPQMTSRELLLLERAGYGPDFACILLSKAEGGKASYDAYSWGDRTMTAVHRWVTQHWSDLSSGELLDVRIILGERVENP